MKPDAERAYRVFDLIQKYPEQHDQGSFMVDRSVNYPLWGETYQAERLEYERKISQLFSLDEFTGRCNTVACMAGWTVLDAGLQVDMQNRAFDEEGTARGSIFYAARQLLGLDYDDADKLFYNTSNSGLAARILQLFGPDPRKP